ncbi:MAG: dipeptide epimerase [Alphaproteobacteria bacterium]|jgi:L-Ala-D/L-Glu epimerase|nr:dipeptide epimerase [Alphaproteobacteria bacterium]
MRKLEVKREEFLLRQPFKIAHGTRYVSEVIYVKLSEGNFTGEAESVPYARYGEDCALVIKQIEEVRLKIERGAGRADVQKLLKHGAARNVLDCALWSLECHKAQQSLAEMANLTKPKPIETAYTLVIDEPHIMAREALALKAKYRILKLKLAGDKQDKQRIIGVRKAATDNVIILDANESWPQSEYSELLAICVAQNIAMIEQPFRVGEDDILLKIKSKIPICADESCHIAEDLVGLMGKYEMINIKLDKAGGLTEAINLYNLARSLNFKIMVGCMVGSSLSILPAYYLAQQADLVDLDCALLLKQDRNLLTYAKNKIFL